MFRVLENTLDLEDNIVTFTVTVTVTVTYHPSPTEEVAEMAVNPPTTKESPHFCNGLEI